MDYEIVIGLEVHVQLLTETKMFCSCRNQFTHEPNSNVCPVCIGMPGTLPVINKQAFELGILGALGLGCEIPELTKFDRKHYYYPDLPKNYQISQYDLPVSQNGIIEVEVDGVRKKFGVTRAHLEEDAGKLMHESSHSNVDLNRTGTPLLEIVSEPDMRSPQEARAYLEMLKLILQYTGISDCNMEEGSLRCDANVSIRPRGETKLGTKNEIKNMNSFRGVEAALTMVVDELLRQTEAGEAIRQVTWGYSIDRNQIFKMRVKEDANDYRYFPDPDLPAVHVGRDWVEAIRARLPELPLAKKDRFMKDYGLSDYDAGLMIQDKKMADYFEETTRISNMPKEAANWIQNDLARELSSRKVAVEDTAMKPEALAELLDLVSKKTINVPTARRVFMKILDGDTASPAAIVEKEGLAQVSDTGPIKDALEEAIKANPKAVADIEGGKPATAMFFVGQIMRTMKGKADPEAVAGVIAERFGIDPEILKSNKKKK